ncbi:MAG: DUF1223 domain-containing protein [Bacteroidetes bacterium]|nr:DUF1223 domain-containing protein [Bacteroidota bacterium]
MKLKILIIIAVLGAVAVITSAFTVKNPADKGFAVVELFTSEGCSSCPPADALVAKIQKESAGKPVYILAFHVDYWDRLGWKDAFSDAAYTNRQKQYARWLRSSELYTPQAIVNGTKEMVGSEESKLRSSIHDDLQNASKTELTLTVAKTAGNKASLKYQAGGTTAGSSLVIALIEKNATTKVLKGENAGRTISHVQIVRELQTTALNDRSSGTASISLPAGFSPEAFEVIGFVQNTSNGAITGAAKAEFFATLSK